MLSDTFSYKIQLISRRLHDVGKRDFAPLGMTRGNFVVFCMIHESPGITQAELAAKCIMDRNVLVKTIDKLEEQGYVKRVRGQKDRRVFTLYTTPAGEEAIAAYWDVFVKGNDERFSVLTSQQREAFREILDTLLEHL